MAHTLTTAEIYALHHTAVALRPDWHHNRPGSTWQKQLTDAGTPMTLEHAQSFWHAINALHTYATQQTDDGTPVKRTPKYFLEAGKHWEQTRPAEHAEKLPPCEQHPEYGTTKSCKACKSEIAAGDRPDDKIGEVYEPPPTK